MYIAKINLFYHNLMIMNLPNFIVLCFLSFVILPHLSYVIILEILFCFLLFLSILGTFLVIAKYFNYLLLDQRIYLHHFIPFIKDIFASFYTFGSDFNSSDILFNSLGTLFALSLLEI